MDTGTNPRRWFVGKLAELLAAAGRPSQAELLSFDRERDNALSRSSLSDLLSGKFKKAPPWERIAAYGRACVAAGHAHGTDLPLETTLKRLRAYHDILTEQLETDSRHPAARLRQSRPEAPQQPTPSRRMFGAVPVRADGFQVREVAEQLTRTVDGRGTTALAGAATIPTIVLTGLGGVGKTQVAAHHAHTRWDADDVDLLLWISARSRDAIIAAYTDVAVDLLGADPATPERAWRRLLAWLAETSRRWLIVFDDLQQPAHITGLWPPHSAVGQVVLTTRRRDAVLRGHRRQIVEVGLYTPIEGLNYLVEKLPARARTDSDKATLAELAGDLGHLPLALAQAAAYLINKPLLSTAGYRVRLAERRTALRDILPEVHELPDEHEQTVAATWAISIDAANQLAPAGLAQPVLELTSLLDSSGIPAAAFSTEAVTNHLAERLGRDLTAEQAQAGLESLHRFSLLSLDPQEPPHAIRVHALVQRVVRDSLDEEALADLAWAAADALLALWPDIESDHELREALRSNTAVLRETAEQGLWCSVGHPLLWRALESLGDAGLLDSAITAATQLHDCALRYFGADHPDTLAARARLAAWRGAAGDPTGAARALEELLADRLRLQGPDHADTLSTNANLAAWRGESGDPAGAAETLEEVLADQLRILGPANPNTLVTRNNIAYWRGEAGDPAGAAELLDVLLADYLRVLGPDDLGTLTTRNSLARWRAEAGDPLGAAAALEDLLADRLRILGPDHPHTLSTRASLAGRRGDAGDPGGAAEALEELLADYLRIVGPSHPDALSTRSGIAHWSGESGDVTRACEAFEELLADQLQILGPDHPQTLGTRSNVAFWRARAGDFTGAVVALEELLTDQLQILGPDHPQTLGTRGNLAALRERAGDAAADVIDTLEEVLADQLRVLGRDHPHTLRTRNNLADLRGQAGDPAAAVDALEEVLADQLRILGPDHPQTLTVRANLAAWQAEAGDPAAARDALERLLSDQVRVLGPNHLDTLNTRRYLADHGESE
ncbi:tetratricopeptide repeat protein [Amycolatopsis sp. CA-126428]|uniref:tetratricopeptide repeat protein n=1 Tax=Amycolatopsis sp. CA-126428 TaxID=2073158 RepID=UPI000CD202F3|nr:tetratricopeptide repeat protein [Amycolatopsis sp. CA-126428]